MAEQREVEPELRPGQMVMAVPPSGARRLCHVDRINPNGLVVLSFPLPRGKGRYAWAVDPAWLNLEEGEGK